MLITCAVCQFEREIDIDRIPATASMATCPKCGNRFRFRDPQSGDFIQFDPKSATPQPVRLPTEQDGDDPLPPGAVIPTMEDPVQKPAPTIEAKNEKPKFELFPKLDKLKLTLPLAGLLEKLTSLLPPKRENKSEPAPLFPPKQEDQDEQGSPLGWREEIKGVPWENQDDYGLFGSLYHTILAVMFRSKDFFTHIWSTQPLTMAAIFYVLLNYFAIIISSIWGLLPVQGSGTSVLALAGAEDMSIPLILIILPFSLLLNMFIQAGLFHLMIRLVQPEEANFPTTARVIAYSSAPLVLSLAPFIGSMIGFVWSVALSFIGCKYAHNLSWNRTVLALAPLFLLEFAVSFQMRNTILILFSGASV